MRSYENGTLKWMSGVPGMPPYNLERVPLFNVPSPHVLKRLSPERMFGIVVSNSVFMEISPQYSAVLGDPRTNQNPAFLTLGILFYRWHNELASRIKKDFPKWRDEEVFQAARRMNIATLQVNLNSSKSTPGTTNSPTFQTFASRTSSRTSISRRFWGKRCRVTAATRRTFTRGYRTSFRARLSGFEYRFKGFWGLIVIVNEEGIFDDSRYGHTLIPPGIYRRGKECGFKTDFQGSPATRLCSTWWDAQVRALSFQRNASK